jgi:hypothetical protein
MTDLTPKIMQQVRKMETERLMAIFVIGGVCIVGSVLALVLSTLIMVAVLTELGSWELLKIREYGWQSLGIFWVELPKIELSTALVGLAIGIIIFIRILRSGPAAIRKMKYLMKL